ncbi:hypothetical protein SASPL_130848 [Salvia splendens]|uniref:Uncharacterized protein n=1 Tax=Salvia splendens TaxID=180675 RepID=A0A8X8ZKE8_SALSN|nr:hypothetical protein SASPL_130848 [Salvia splendens]
MLCMSRISGECKPKGDCTRRSWTDLEEETLVVWLKELSVTRWKSDWISGSKDRADGMFSEELMDAANALSSRNTVRSSPSREFGSSMGLEDENPIVTPTGSVPHEGMLAKMQEDTNARLDCLSLWIGYDFDLSKARKEVYEVLGRLPLTRDQKFDVCEIILEKVQRITSSLGCRRRTGLLTRSAYLQSMDRLLSKQT